MIKQVAMLVALTLTAAAVGASDNVAEDVEAWFITEYDPLWSSTESVDPVKVKEHRVDVFRTPNRHGISNCTKTQSNVGSAR